VNSNLILCQDCKFWKRPEEHLKWRTWNPDGTSGPYGCWGKEEYPCSKVEDLLTVEIEIYGDARASHEVYTKGNFGCVLGEKKDA
jgi:hypothetical protein